MTHTLRPSASNEQGNVLFYVLVCVAIIGALSYVMSQGSGDSASGMQASQISEEIKTQAQTIRSALLECNLVHNYGYPAAPVSGLVADLECQTGEGPPITYEDIFSGTGNRFMPPTPKPFTTGWQYVIDTATNPDSISIELTDTLNCTANAGLRSAIQILSNQYTSGELVTVCDGTTASIRIFIVQGVI